LAVDELDTVAASRTRTRLTVVGRTLTSIAVVSRHATLALVAGRVMLTIAMSCIANVFIVQQNLV